ncbi:MAG TPA: outer membrane beta-barrel protein [Terriglobales bacterium]|nr:outer membrane beta-barrel protein [Terriglobales bacterium]
MNGTMMKRVAIYAAFVVALAGPAFSQASAPAPAYNFQVGIFAEDLRLGRVDPTLDMPGAGARFSLFPQSWFQLEMEGSYDFAQTFTTSWTNGFVTDNLTTHLRVASGLGGVKMNKRLKKKLRLFATVKAGFIDFTSSTQNIPQGFTNPQDPATRSATDFLLYPGGGLEYSFAGHWGLRADVGDDLYFDHGHRYNNIRGTFGPTFRF